MTEKAPPEIVPNIAEHGVWGTKSQPVGGFGEGYDAQVARGADGDLPSTAQDTELGERVRKSLAHAHIDAANLRVEVKAAQVTLYGSVHHPHEKSQLEARARAVPGIVSVTSELSVLDEVREES